MACITTKPSCPFLPVCPPGEAQWLPGTTSATGSECGSGYIVSTGILDITKIPPNFERLSSLQSRVAQAVPERDQFHDPAVSKKLAKVKFPIHFVDFETFSPALPLYPETRPLPDDSVSMVRSHPHCRRWSVASRVSPHGPQRPAPPIRHESARKRRAQRLYYCLRKFRVHTTEGVGQALPRHRAGVRPAPARASSTCYR